MKRTFTTALGVVLLSVSQMIMLGKRPVQFSAGVRYWAESTDIGAADWGFRLAFTLLYPK